MAVYFFEDFTRKIIILNYLGISCLIQNLRHTKCGRMRGMVVGEGGRSSGVLLYFELVCFV